MNNIEYIVKHPVKFQDEYDFLETILTSNGVEDVEAFLNVGTTNTHDPFLMQNMREGVNLFLDVMKKKEPQIYVQIDSDVDGYTSGSIITQFIHDNYPHATVDFKTSPGKKHGIRSSYIPDGKSYDLIIIPDAGSNDLIDCKLLHKRGYSLLILDHHIKEKTIKIKDKDIPNNIDDYAIVINCTDGTYPNPTLTGAGVVYKFLDAVCETLETDGTEIQKYLELVALGMIADDADMRNLETRYYTLQGLKEANLNNDFLKEVRDRDDRNFKFGATIKNTGWNIAPLINAVVRYGSEDEQRNTIRAIIGEQEEFEYQPKRKSAKDPKPPIETHSLQKTMARVCSNCKGRQDNEVRGYVAKLSEKIESENLQTNNILVVDSTEIVKSNTVTGLIANKLTTKYRRPVVLLKAVSDNMFGGSMRSYGKGDLLNFKEMLTNTGLFDSVLGHKGAAGIKIEKDNVNSLITMGNQIVKKEDLVDVYEVDYEMKASEFKKQYVTTVANAYAVWSKHVPEPLFAITGLHINAENIQGISREGSDYVSTIRFKYNDVWFIKRFCCKGEFEELTCHSRNIFGKNKKNLVLTLICTFNMDKYEDTAYPEVTIKRFESVEDKGNSERPNVNVGNKTVMDDDEFVF